MSRPSVKDATKQSKQDTRQALIDAGSAIISEKGFNNTGIEEILKAVGVPKGSFYYYFSSKSDFGLSIINNHAELYEKKLARYFGDTSMSPVKRLRKYFEDSRDDMQNNACRKGCLFGNLGQEMADQHEAFRLRLAEVFQDWCRALSDCIREAQQAGEIPAHFDADHLAEFCQCSWEGAILRSKVTKSAQPLDTFITYLFDELFTCRK